MDALDEVLKGKSVARLSRETQLIILEAVEKIAETVQRDFQSDASLPDLRLSQKRKKVKVVKDGGSEKSPRKRKPKAGIVST